MKIKILLMIFIFTNILLAQEKVFVINHSGLIDERAYEKINQIGLEVQEKLNVAIYLDVKGNNGIDTSLGIKEKIILMKAKEQELLAFVKKETLGSYVILTASLDHKYSNILFSEDLKDIIDRDDILDGYVIPLLAAKDKNILKSKVSAAMLNGYAQIGDAIAANKNVILKSSIGSQGKTAGTIWKVFMYSIVIFGIIVYFIIILRERKYKAEQSE